MHIPASQCFLTDYHIVWTPSLCCPFLPPPVRVWVHLLWAVPGGSPTPVWAEVLWCSGSRQWCRGRSTSALPPSHNCLFVCLGGIWTCNLLMLSNALPLKLGNACRHHLDTRTPAWTATYCYCRYDTFWSILVAIGLFAYIHDPQKRGQRTESHWLKCNQTCLIPSVAGVLVLKLFSPLAQFFNLARTLHEHMDNLESMFLNPFSLVCVILTVVS